MPPRITEAEDVRRKLCEVPATLNGEPARISGYRNDFATVTQLDSGLSAEWSWPAVRRIVEQRDGAFKTR